MHTQNFFLNQHVYIAIKQRFNPLELVMLFAVLATFDSRCIKWWCHNARLTLSQPSRFKLVGSMTFEQMLAYLQIAERQVGAFWVCNSMTGEIVF